MTFVCLGFTITRTHTELCMALKYLARVVVFFLLRIRVLADSRFDKFSDI